jgi:hypothetical protein
VVAYRFLVRYRPALYRLLWRSVAVDLELASGSAPAAVVAGVAEIDGVLEVRCME